MLYIILEIILLSLIFILIRVIYKREISKFLSHSLKILCILWIVLGIVEIYKYNQLGMDWEINNFELKGIYTYTIGCFILYKTKKNVVLFLILFHHVLNDI